MDNCEECIYSPVCKLWWKHERKDASCYTDPKGDKGGCTLFVVKADSLDKIVTCKKCLHCSVDYTFPFPGSGPVRHMSCAISGKNIDHDHFCNYGVYNGRS